MPTDNATEWLTNALTNTIGYWVFAEPPVDPVAGEPVDRILVSDIDTVRARRAAEKVIEHLEPLLRELALTGTGRERPFDEQTLRADVAAHWGEHGAHVRSRRPPHRRSREDRAIRRRGRRSQGARSAHGCDPRMGRSARRLLRDTRPLGWVSARNGDQAVARDRGAPMTLDEAAVERAVDRARDLIELEDVGDYGYGGETIPKYVPVNMDEVVRAAISTYLTETDHAGVIPELRSLLRTSLETAEVMAVWHILNATVLSPDDSDLEAFTAARRKLRQRLADLDLMEPS